VPLVSLGVIMFAFVADVHVGNHAVMGGDRVRGINTRCRLVVETLQRAVDAAIQRGASDFVVLGDLFDSHRPTPQVVAAVMAVLSTFPGSVHVLRGNHDAASDEVLDDALAPLAFCPNVRVYSRPDCVESADGILLLVPYRPGPSADWLQRDVQVAFACRGMQPLGGVPLPICVAVHLGLRDAANTKANPWAALAEDAVDVSDLAVVCASVGAQMAVAGNWHGHFRWQLPGVEAVQVGALAPTGWDNPGLDGYGRVEFWPPGPGRSGVEVAGPRFLNRIPSRGMVTAAPSGCVLYARLRDTRERVVEAQIAVQSAIASGLLAGGVVEVEAAGAQAEAREAVSLALSGALAERAVHDHATAMELDPGVDRADVTARALRYLRGGA